MRVNDELFSKSLMSLCMLSVLSWQSVLLIMNYLLFGKISPWVFGGEHHFH